MAKRLRSPAYPAISISDALQRAQQLYDKEAGHWSPLSIAVTHWGYSPKSSGGLKAISALKSYGLMDDKGSGANREVRLSESALSIIHDEREDDSERKWHVSQAAQKPKIIGSLMSKFPDSSVSDSNIEFYLKQQDYNPNSISDILKVYKDALNHLVVQDDYSTVENEDDQETEVVPMINANVKEVEPVIPSPKTVPESVGSEEIEFSKGRLSRDVGYRLIVSGEMGSGEIGKLIKLLEAQKMVLED